MTSQDDRLSAPEVRRRAKRGILVVGLRSIGLRVIQVAGLLVLSRQLSPKDFGAVAIGLVFVGVIMATSQGGLGAMLIRRREPPAEEELAGLLGFQLAVASVLAIVVAGVAVGFGREGQVTALMVVSLPIVVLRAPGVVVLERRLEYRPIAYADIAETLTYYAWAIATVEVGWGVWGLASAVVPRAVAGSAAVIVGAPDAVHRPSLSRRVLRELLPFGLRLQVIDFVNLVREQGLNLGIAAVAGLDVLGIWSLAYRIMQLPYVLFTTLWRVSFPAMSRLVGGGEDMRPVLERAVALTAVASGAVLVPLTAGAPAGVPAILGDKWHDVADVIPWASLALMIGAPVSVAVAGYLYALGDAGVPLRATVAHTVVWIAVALALIIPVGVAGAALGWVAASIVDVVVLGRAASRASGARFFPRLVLPTSIAVAVGAAGWAAGSAGDGLAWAVVAAVAAETVFLLGVAIGCRDVGRQLVRALAEAT